MNTPVFTGLPVAGHSMIIATASLLSISTSTILISAQKEHKARQGSERQAEVW